MSDVYGAIPLPLVAPSAGDAAGDPALNRIAEFAKAVINARVSAVWSSVAPTTPMVRTIFAHDPKPEEFNEKDLPALYVYRSDDAVFDGSEEYMGDDYRVAKSTVVVLWVASPATQDKRALRAPPRNALVKALDQALERGRDPSYVVAGDPDADAATYGSVLARFAGLFSALVHGARRTDLTISVTDARTRVYPALEIRLTVEEALTTDLDDFDQGYSVDAKYYAPDGGTGLGPLLVDEEIYD